MCIDVSLTSLVYTPHLMLNIFLQNGAPLCNHSNLGFLEVTWWYGHRCTTPEMLYGVQLQCWDHVDSCMAHNPTPPSTLLTIIPMQGDLNNEHH